VSQGERYRVGVDLVDIAQVGQAVATFGPRYLTRVYTPHELTCAARGTEFDHSSLAARFSAKEAVVKVLRPSAARPPWRSIEVRRLPSGACDVALSDSAASLADGEGITSMALSMTHEGPMAASVVVATCREPALTEYGKPDWRQAMDLTEMRRGRIETQIHDILREFGRLPIDPAGMDDEDDLFEMGMTSHASVNVMLALEEVFDLEFPEPFLRKSTFESVFAIAAAVTFLKEDGTTC
jgi:phosphopantetheine--protein transferase-like protein